MEGFLPSAVSIHLRDGRSTPCDVLLDRDTEIRVTVIDAETEEPIVGAQVSNERGGATYAVTGPDGSFTLRVADGHRLSVWVQAERYAAFRWAWDVMEVALLEAPRIPMLGLAWIDGIVADAKGVPQGGVAVEVEHNGHPSRAIDLDFDRRVQCSLLGHAEYWAPSEGASTDELGRFSLGVVPDDSENFVTVDAPGYARARAGPVVLEIPGRRHEMKIVLAEGATIRGRLIQNGRPLQNGFLHWTNEYGGNGLARSDVEGRCELDRIPSGEITLHVSSESRADVIEPVALFLASGQIYERDFEWTEWLATISGRATNPDGEPIQGVRVNALVNVAGGGFYETQTGADGTYSIEVPTGHRYDVIAHGKAERQHREEVDPGTSHLDFVFADVGHLKVIFVDADSGNPVTIANFDTWTVAWRVSGRNDFQAIHVSPSHNGEVDLGLPIGSVDLSIYANSEGYAPRQLFGVRVDREPNPSPVVVELTRGIEALIALVGDSPLDRELLEGHSFFFLERFQVDLVRGPFPNQGGPSNFRIGGINLWLAEPGLMGQLLQLDETGLVLLRGLAPGTYSLKVFPDDLTFQPAEMAVAGPRTELEVRWSSR